MIFYKLTVDFFAGSIGSAIHLSKIIHMKKIAILSAVVLTTITLQSCRQSDDVLSPEEAATLRRAQDSSNQSLYKGTTINMNEGQSAPTISDADGEILPPPRK
ncbi:hypothetical protein ACM44_09455 [Chryseobacterium koreense CCUG 49689]|uniref:Uncharacterized protein n=2 Tax=Chryseobacterium koreense TaxID=232216 RepID=A0A0J7IXX4_9FLAO|nr:hypothetical protein ACM44_09455 [Chryseobacterium koreense CCUG 49689]